MANDEWNIRRGAYATDPKGWLHTKGLQRLGVGPSSWKDHVNYSASRQVPATVSAAERFDSAYDKAADFYRRTNVAGEDNALSRIIGLTLILGAGTKHQSDQGLKHFRNQGIIGTRTSDNWAPNFVDWMGGMTGTLGTHFGKTRSDFR